VYIDVEPRSTIVSLSNFEVSRTNHLAIVFVFTMQLYVCTFASSHLPVNRGLLHQLQFEARIAVGLSDDTVRAPLNAAWFFH
jgi:hypothetical protein